MRKKQPATPALPPIIGDKKSDYEDTGFCSYCLLSLEAKQPGGLNPRHKATHTPFLKCPQAIRARETKKV